MEHDKSEIFYFSRAHNDLNLELDLSVKIVEGGLCSFLFSLFYFSFSFFFYSLFLFLEQLRLGVISPVISLVTTPSSCD